MSLILIDERSLINILLVLTTLSFSQSIGNDSLYYWGGIVNKDGALVIDFKKIDNTSGIYNIKKISDFKKYSKGDAGDASFFTIPKADVANLVTSKQLEEADYGDCYLAVYAVYDNLYGLIGYGAKAIDEGDIQPSFTAMVKNGPKKIEFKNLPDGFPEASKKLLEQYFTFPQTCEGGFSNIIFGMNHEGVTDAVCHPNTKIPDDTSKCADGSKPKYYLKGYKYATFYDVDAAGLKDLLTRFGPVLILSGPKLSYYDHIK
ncbi:MAG: hypothetical protein EZS28_024932 [Streblomastix strix]|uniref:Uncharacterized protein n=1 Tax=Streblomastix strix TaxID=222440 RepID=A0A5J4VAN5_9EUKA|nr:MAG: hypothetical protein EZS28_024932 [Streblomastix strix]